MSSHHQRALALAGLIQSCQQVNRVARYGNWNESDAQTCIHSLFQIDADSVEDVYEGSSGLRSGLQFLKNVLEKKVERTDMEITQYALTLLHLERKLINNTSMLDQIRQHLYQIKNEFDIQDVSNITLVSRIADTYVQTISTIPPKVQVEGSREHLSQLNNTYKVRAMLFSGIRSAVLWRQLGGTRMGLLFGRRKLLNTVNQILEA